MKKSLEGKVVKKYGGVEVTAIILKHYSGYDDLDSCTDDICSIYNRTGVYHKATFDLVYKVLIVTKEDAYKVLQGNEIEFWFANRCEF